MVKKSNLLLFALSSVFTLTTPEERQGIVARVGSFLKLDRRGLVYRLPKETFDAVESCIMPVVRARLLALGLEAETMVFNLPYVPVANVASSAPLTEQDIAALLQKGGAARKFRLHSAHIMRDTADAGAKWSLNLDVSGADGETRPHTLVFSATGLSEELRQGLLALTDEVNALIGEGIAMQVRDASVVEYGPLGNAIRELYRISLEDGRIWDTTSGEQVVGKTA